MHALTERPLRLVPPLTPAAPATPCPRWCVVRNHENGDRFHYADAAHAGPVQLRLEILQDESKVVHVCTDSADGDFMDLAEVDALLAALQIKRRELAALLAAPGGAA